MYLTRSPWDAEDLFQETLLKAFGLIAKTKQPIFSKSFLFRVASNKWIDECRRNKVKYVPYEENISASGTVNDVDNLESEDGIRRILKRLSPKQAVILLLIDVFEFSGREAAELLGSTETAVNTAIHRARKKLRKTTGTREEAGGIPLSRKRENTLSEEEEAVLNQFVKAFRNRDIVNLIELLDDHAVANVIVHNSAEYGKTVITKSSLAGWENIHTQLDIQRVFLWGRSVVMFLSESDGAPVLWDINTIETEMGKIIRWDSYYFSIELLQEAAKACKMSIDTSKEMYGKIWS